MDEYLKRVFVKILNSDLLKALGDGIPELLVEHARSVVWMCRCVCGFCSRDSSQLYVRVLVVTAGNLFDRAVDNMNEAMEKAMADVERKLIHSHRLLSRISQWLEEKLLAAEVCSKLAFQ